MNGRPGNSQRSVRVWVRLIPAPLFLLFPLFISRISASAATSGFSSQSAGAIVAAARTAMTAAGSVSATGTAPENLPGVGMVTTTETNYSGKTSGSQVIKTTSSQSGSSVTLPAATTLVVDGALYVNANAEFWSSSAGFSEAKSNLVAQKWVEIPTSSPLYEEASSDLTMPTLTKDLFHANTYHKGGIRTVDGIRAIEITFVNSGTDSGRASAYVALGGKHLPVSVTIGGVPFQLGSWGVAKIIAKPQGSIPLSSLLASGST